MGITVADGIAYIGATNGVVSAVRLNDGTPLWHYLAYGSADEQPLLVDGTIYISTAFDTGPGGLYALRASDGTLRWHYTSESHLMYLPVIVNGTVYAGSQDGAIVALRATDGGLIWRYKINGLSDRPAFYQDKVYVLSSQQSLLVLRAANGSLLYTLKKPFLATPQFAYGRAYVSTGDGFEYAFEPETGSLLWQFQHEGISLNPPLIVNGIVYVVATRITSEALISGSFRRSGSVLPLQFPRISAHASVYALRTTDGVPLWHYQGNSVDGWSWAALADDVLYISTAPGKGMGYLSALRISDGSLLWSRALDDEPASPVSIGNGIIYLGAVNGNIYAFRAGNGLLLWSYTIRGAVLNSPVFDGRTVYIGAANGIVYALQAQNGSLLWHYLVPENKGLP